MQQLITHQSCVQGRNLYCTTVVNLTQTQRAAKTLYELKNSVLALLFCFWKLILQTQKNYGVQLFMFCIERMGQKVHLPK